MRRVDRLRKESRGGEGQQRLADMLYAKAHDPEEPLRDRVAAAREWRQMTRDLKPAAAEGDGLDDLAARRKARRRAG